MAPSRAIDPSTAMSPAADGIGSDAAPGGLVSSSRGWLRTTLSRHTLPDRSWHFDWFIQTEADGEAPLCSFRTSEPLHRVAAGPVHLEAIPDHRAVYLCYTGEVRGGRGLIEPVARGLVDLAWDVGGARGRVWFGASGPRAIALSPSMGRVWTAMFV